MQKTDVMDSFDVLLNQGRVNLFDWILKCVKWHLAVESVYSAPPLTAPVMVGGCGTQLTSSLPICYPPY